VRFVPPEYQMKWQLVESDQECLKLNGTYQVLVYAQCSGAGWKHKYVRKNTQILVDASRGIGTEIKLRNVSICSRLETRRQEKLQHKDQLCDYRLKG
jgi:hypothetical protein